MSDIYSICLEDDSLWQEIRQRTRLSPTETRVLRCSCMGLDTKSVMVKLSKAAPTIYTHRGKAFAKLRVSHMEAAIRKLMSLALEIYTERNLQSKGNVT